MNIHAYQPEDSVLPFKLKTTLSTGHTANIFSTKFMPHSNDSTLVTCAGDGEVRVFDIERAATTSSESSVRGQRFDNRYRGVKYYSQNNTNGRVYRSHGDRVKRIVTESSPHLFLTCSEDGEVRQFDLRLPSSAYPAPRGSRGFSRSSGPVGKVPPPLISYKKYRLDLNTISCSASQPHYIALGGAHLHCFLHDRRMLGRDISDERGQPGSATLASDLSSNEEELMGQATRCVRRFAPNGQKKARRTHNPHITACKISDENPSEMIVSWSGDHVYSFNLLGKVTASQDAGDCESRDVVKGKGKSAKDHNQKRKKEGSSTSLEDTERKRAKARLRRQEATSLQIKFEDGHNEQVALDDLAAEAPRLPARPQIWLNSHLRGRQIAKSMTRIRKLMFSLDDCSASTMSAVTTSEQPVSSSFEQAFELTKTLLPDMNEICRLWKYPVDPTEDEVHLQKTLRAHRDAARSFVQASGVLANELTDHEASIPKDSTSDFDRVRPPPNCGPQLLPDHTFSLDFVKAICLWLQGGRSALLEGFRATLQQTQTSRLPIPAEADEGGIDDHLIPYLIQLAQPRPIPNIEVSRFEKDETRQLFASESAAVIAFSSTIRMPLEDLSRAILPATQGPHGEKAMPAAQDRRTATIFWGHKVARGLLLIAGEGLNYEVINLAFGGLGVDSDDSDEGREHEDIDPNAMENVVESVCVRDENYAEGSRSSSHSSQHEGEAVVSMEDIQEEVADQLDGEDEDEEGNEGADEDDEDDDDDEDDGDDEDDEDDEDEDGDPYSNLLHYSAARGKLREAVEKGVPCFSHTRKYRGHCNVKTVKDANFFGLQDEYVVSGSDLGHLFIWDKKTGEVVNILEGDSQVVNVVQGKRHFSTSTIQLHYFRALWMFIDL